MIALCTPTASILADCAMLNDVKRTAIHGGSLRLFVESMEGERDSVNVLLEEEANRKVDRIDDYLDFADRVQTIKQELLTILLNLKVR